MKPTFGSVFSGCGAMDLGFEQAGFECKWQIEINENCQKVLAKHFPNTRKYRDVKQVLASDLTPVDCICGGVPCTDISSAGKRIRKGLDGDQTGLIRNFGEIVRSLKPKFFLIENVPQLLKVWPDVLAMGYFDDYVTEGKVLIGADFGGYTRRRRAFFVGCLRAEYGGQVFDFPVGPKPAFRTRGTDDVLPMCVPWGGGVSLDRLGACVITEVNPVGTVQVHGHP